MGYTQAEVAGSKNHPALKPYKLDNNERIKCLMKIQR